jgi:hypothetical protein
MNGSVHIPKQPVEVTLIFESPAEANDLLSELRMWTPSGGWSLQATLLFKLLREASGKK